MRRAERSGIAGALALAAALVLAAAAPARADAPGPRAPRSAGTGAEPARVRIDTEARRGEAAREGKAWIRRLPLGDGRHLDLELEPFAVTSPGTRFVLGRKGRPDRPLDLDPARVALFRGRVRSRPSSSVFLALGPESVSGSIDLGAGAGRFRLSPRDVRGRALGGGEAALVALDEEHDRRGGGAAHLPSQAHARRARGGVSWAPERSRPTRPTSPFTAPTSPCTTRRTGPR